MAERELELAQLDEYHARVGQAAPAEQVNLLLSGFMPEDDEALIQAGIRCLPLIESDRFEVSDAAARRLAALMLQLKLAPDRPDVRRVLGQFDKAVADHRRKEAGNLRFGFALLAALALAAAGVIAWIIYWWLK
jgi:hypothetical protein